MPKEEKATEAPAGKVRAGFNEKGEAYKGVDPESGERVTVVLSELRREFGTAKGEEMYRQIARATRTGDIFQNLNQYAPDISLGGVDDKVREAVARILEGGNK